MSQKQSGLAVSLRQSACLADVVVQHCCCPPGIQSIVDHSSGA